MLNRNGAVAACGRLRVNHDHVSARSYGAIVQADDHATDLDVLQLLLRPLFAEADCRSVAKNLLASFGSLGGVIGASQERLASEIGQPAASFLKALHMALQRVLRERLVERPLLGSWQALEDYLSVSLRHDAREKLIVLFLDRKNGLIREEIIQEGTVDHVPTYPREIAKRALELDASAIIMVHNHPSGDPTPSGADREITRRVIAALRPLEIAMHDHAIVGRNKVVSLRQLRAI